MKRAALNLLLLYYRPANLHRNTHKNRLARLSTTYRRRIFCFPSSSQNWPSRLLCIGDNVASKLHVINITLLLIVHDFYDNKRRLLSNGRLRFVQKLTTAARCLGNPDQLDYICLLSCSDEDALSSAPADPTILSC
jgi:hypothetical protein